MDKQVQKKGIKKSLQLKSKSAKAAINFGLEEAEFESMLFAMQKGDESLFEQVFLTQFEESMKYLMNRYRINRSEAYDVTMDALLKFRKRLLAGKITYGNMRFLFTRMAGQFLSDSNKHRTVLIDDAINDLEPDDELDESVLDALDKAWKQLCKDCSGLLEEFYYQKIALKTIAIQLEKSEAATRKQKQRCLEKLRLYFLKYFET